jgi:hypothetical protein
VQFALRSDQHTIRLWLDPNEEGSSMAGNLKWWLVILCSVTGLGFAIAHGYIAQMWRIDAYKVSYSTDQHYRLKLLLGPALLAACAGSFAVVGSALGYAWPAALPESFEYMAHRPVVVDQHKRWVDVLLVSRKPFESAPRLHRIPWSQAMEEALETAQAMKEGQAGGEIVMEAGGGPGHGDSYPAYVPKRILPQQQRPKGNTPPSSAPLEQHSPPPGTRPPAYV